MKLNRQKTILSTAIFSRSTAARLSLPLATAIAAGIAFVPEQAQAQTLFYKSTTAGNAWTGSFWGTSAAGPFNTAWVSGRAVNFVDNGGVALALTGATTNFSSIVANESVNVTASGTIGTGGTVASITVAAGKNMNFGTQAISVAAGTGFIKNGDGILTISTGSAFTGGFTINAGTMAVGGVNAMGAGGALTINGGTIRSNSTTARDLTGKYAGGITIGGNFTVGDATNNGALTFTNNMALGANSRAITVNSAATFGGIISGNAAVGIVKDGAGTLTLSNVGNNYTGITSITAGILNAATFAPGGSNSSIGAGAVAATNLVLNGGTLQYNTAAAATTNRLFSVGTSGGTIDSSHATAANSLSFTGTGDIGLNSQLGTRTLTLTGTNTGSNTIALKIVDDASANATSLTKSAAGTWILTNANTYTGTTTIGGGVTSTLEAGHASALGVGGNITFNGNGRIRYTAASAAQDYSSRFKNSTFAVGVDTNGQNVTFAGIIDSSNIGGQGLTKFGAGTLTLSVANSYTGSTQIAGGTLRLAHINAVSSSSSLAFNTASGNILQIGTDTPFTAANLPSISAGFSSSGTTNIVSDRATTGAGPLGVGLTHALGVLNMGNTQMNITAGTNVTSGTAAISFASVSFGTATADGTTTFNPTTANLFITGNVTSGAGALGFHNFTLGGTSSGNLISGDIVTSVRPTQNVVKSGTSIWTLSGANTYNGTTTATGGALITTTAAALPGYNAAARVVFNGGTIGVRIGAGGWTTPEVDLLLTAGNATKTSGALGIDTSIASQNQWTDFTTGASSLGALGLTKLGTNTLTLNSTSNNYAGATTIDNGTLKLDVDHTLTGPLNFGFINDTASNTGNLDLATTNVNATLGGLNVRTNSATANTITIGTGKSLTLTGSTVANVVFVGSTALGAQAKLQVTGLGTLTVTDATRNIVVANTTSLATTTGATASAVMDLSGLANFTADIANVYVGRPTSAAGAAVNNIGKSTNDILALAGSNTINASGVIAVGGSTNSTGSTPATPAKLILGTTNNLNAASFVLGSSRMSGLMEFNTGLTNPIVTIRGATGGSTRTNIYLGDQANLQLVSFANGASTVNLGKMDFTGGTVNAMVDNLLVGMGGGALSARASGDGTFIMDGASSNVDVNTLVIGQSLATDTTGQAGTSSIGTFTVKNGTLLVNTAMTMANDLDTTATASGTVGVQGTFTVEGGTATIGATGGSPEHLILGNHANAGNPGLATATVSLTGGTLNVFGDIKEGNLGAGTITSSLSLNGSAAVLDMKGGNITDVDTITYTDGTLKNLGTVNTGMTLAGSGSRVFEQATGVNGDIQGDITGSGLGLTKQGLGKLTLSGGSSYTGPTNVNAGTLLVSGSLSGSSAVSVNNGGTLGGTGTIGGSITVANGGKLSPGASPGTLMVGGDLDLSAVNTAASLVFELGTSSDLIQLTAGTLNIGTGTLGFSDFNFSDFGGMTETTYTLISTNNTILGSLDSGNLSGDFGFFNGTLALADGGTDLVLTVIPEPSSVALLGLGVFGLMRRRRSA